MTQHPFTAILWLWDARKADTWTFVTLPPDNSAAIEDEALSRGPRTGFGSVRVRVTLGGSSWMTSVFPDAASECYVLPIKKAVRRAEGIDAGDEVTVQVEVV